MIAMKRGRGEEDALVSSSPFLLFASSNKN
jgi:hypothetical protein